MVSFFILPYEPSQWETVKSDLSIDPKQYHELLQKQWPYAKIYVPPSDSTYVLRWELNRESEPGSSGGLQRDQQVVSIVPISRSSLLEFILWHRGIIPEEFPLFLSWEVSRESMEITSDITEKNITAFAGLVN